MSLGKSPPRSARSGRLAGALLAALLLLPLAGAFLPGRTLFYRDLGVAVLPVLEEARAGGELLPLWTSRLGNGRPLLANPGNALLAPGSLLYLVLPFEPAAELFLALHLVLGGLGMFWLARRLGAGPPAALVAGCGFGLGGYLVSTTNLYPTLAAAAWAPLVLAAALAAAERASAQRLGLLALALAAMALGGQPEPVILCVAAAGLLALAHGQGSPGRRLLRCTGIFAVAGLWSLLLAAPQVLSTTLHARGSLRSLGFTPEGLLYNSLHPGRLPALVLPFFGGRPLERLSGGYPGAALTDTGTPYFLSIYLGASLVALALAGALLGRRVDEGLPLRRLRPMLLVLATAGVVLSLGRYLPGLSALVETAPLLMPFRYPVKFVFLAALTVPLLAALGVEALSALARARAPESAARHQATLLALLVVLDLGLAHAALVPTIDKDEAWSPIPLAARLKDIARERGIEEGQWRVHHQRLAEGWSPLAASAELDEQELFRAQRRSLLPGTGASEGLAYAFDPSRDLLDPLSYFGISRELHLRGGLEQWLAVGEAGGLFVISPLADLERQTGGLLEALLLGGAELGLPEGRVHVYANRAFVPRLRLVAPGAVATGGPAPKAADVAELFGRYRPNAPWPPPVLLEGAPVPTGSEAIAPADEAAPAPPGQVVLVSESHDRLAVATASTGPALLVVSDTLTPGWSVTVDGRAAEIRRANLAFRGVAVPAGEHAVVFAYRPPGLVPGFVLSGLGLLFVAIAALRERRGRPAALRPGPGAT